VNSRSN